MSDQPRDRDSDSALSTMRSDIPRDTRVAMNREAIQQYVGEVIALEARIEEALDGQIRMSLQHPAAAAAISRFHDMVKLQRDSLKTHLEELGGDETNPVTDVVAKLLGTAARAIDSARLEAVSTVLRDDYLAFNHAAIGYSMLHVAAHGLGHMETMAIADRHLRGYAEAVQEINQILPEVVIWELEKQGFAANRTAVEQCAAAINRAWRETAPAAPSEATAPIASRETGTARRAA